jgi:hypothetical protein
MTDEVEFAPSPLKTFADCMARGESLWLPRDVISFLGAAKRRLVVAYYHGMICLWVSPIGYRDPDGEFIWASPRMVGAAAGCIMAVQRSADVATEVHA